MTSLPVSRNHSILGGIARNLAGTKTRGSAINSEILTCPVDPIIAGCAALLLLIGLVMVASASSEISTRNFGNPFHIFIKHAAYMALGTGCAGGVLCVPIAVWRKLDWVCLLAAFALLIAVLIPGIGRQVNGSTRWISFGLFSVQGSELVKLFSVVFVAGYLSRRRDEVRTTIFGFLKPLGVVVLLSILLLEQPDFGAVVVIGAAIMGVLFLAGVPWRHFLPVIVLALIAIGLIAVWQPYRLQRLVSFTDPWQHQYGGGYQLTQALIAFGRGEWFGLGLGNSIQKLFFLPEAHTDFLFSIIAEELGIAGSLVIIAAFAGLVIRSMLVGASAERVGREFHAWLSYGIALLLGIQAAINIGVNIGMLPTKGLTLPLVSYGGNSLVISCVLVAILLRVEYEVRGLPTLKVAGKTRRGARRG